MRAAALVAILALAACSSNGGTSEARNSASGAGAKLEQAAIERGVISDPDNIVLTGLYARDTDRICVVPDGSRQRIGVFVDYGRGIMCSGSGSVSRSGETLHVELGGGDCRFDARFDNGRIIFPGTVPDGCGTMCAARASFAGLTAERMSESGSEASAMRDGRGRALCAAPSG